MKLVFSREAQIDAALVNAEGIRLFGPKQAETYQIGMREALKAIQAFPLSSPERRCEDQIVRVRPFGAHLIIYAVEGETISILRIRHGREDWQSE